MVHNKLHKITNLNNLKLKRKLLQWAEHYQNSLDLWVVTKPLTMNISLSRKGFLDSQKTHNIIRLKTNKWFKWIIASSNKFKGLARNLESIWALKVEEMALEAGLWRVLQWRRVVMNIPWIVLIVIINSISKLLNIIKIWYLVVATLIK